MIGTAGSGQTVAVVAGTTASIVIIITTVRVWIRSFVDDRISAKLGPVETDVAVLKAQRRTHS